MCARVYACARASVLSGELRIRLFFRMNVLRVPYTAGFSEYVFVVLYMLYKTRLYSLILNYYKMLCVGKCLNVSTTMFF